MEHLSARIMIITNTEPSFYLLLGPYLSRREIVRETGFPIWDEEGKVWFIALKGDCVVGFAALRINDDMASFVSAYVLPVHRGQGIHKLLIDLRLAYCVEHGVTKCKTTATKAAEKNFVAAGFTETRSTKNYTIMEASR